MRLVWFAIFYISPFNCFFTRIRPFFLVTVDTLIWFSFEWLTVVSMKWILMNIALIWVRSISLNGLQIACHYYPTKEIVILQTIVPTNLFKV